MTSTRSLALSAALVLGATILVAPWRPVDPDALSHLAIGKTIVELRGVPATDPLTFSRPLARWSNPEWMGDLLFYLVYRVGGEPTLQIYKLLLICVGWLLALCLAVRRGSSPTIAAALLMIILVGAAARFTLRNELHAYWLVPVYGLVLWRSRERVRCLWLLLPLGALWANLHGSFPVGWVLVGAALVDALRGRDRRRVLALCGLLAAHPFLGMVSPQGIHNYGQLADHLASANIYRALILEWQPPGGAGGLQQFPLHLIALVGLLSFLPRVNRRELEALLLLAAGLALGYASRRFLPLLGLMVVPGVAANLTRWVSATSSRFRGFAGAGALLVASGLLAPVVWGVRTAAPPHLLERPDAPLDAAAYLAQDAPAGSRLFNPFNAGPWLLWKAVCARRCTDGRLRIYIDPRNNLGADALKRYLEVRADPIRFEQEARRLAINLVLVDLSDRRDRALGAHLHRDPTWHSVHRDRRYTVYARGTANQADRFWRRGQSRPR